MTTRKENLIVSSEVKVFFIFIYFFIAMIVFILVVVLTEEVTCEVCNEKDGGNATQAIKAEGEKEASGNAQDSGEGKGAAGAASVE